jgi:hypothetical protein
MAYTSETLGLWTFNQNLYDYVANNNFALYNEDPYVVGPPVTGLYTTFLRFDMFENKYKSTYGLNLIDGVQYETFFESYVSGDFTIAFWMKTETALGFVRHAITRQKTPKTDAVIAKAEKSIVDNEEILDSASFVVIEKAVSETKNQLVLMISPDGTSYSSISSDSYSPGLHHYVLTYDSVNRRAKIDIDGVIGEWDYAPVTNFATTSSLKINSINPDYVVHQATNRVKILRDLYFKSIPVDDETESLRNIKYGIEYVTDTSLVDTDFVGLATSYSQPNTIATNSIITNGSNIFLGMSNGDLLKGVQSIWDNEFIFDLRKKNISLDSHGTGSPEYTDNGMKLSSVFLRI